MDDAAEVLSQDGFQIAVDDELNLVISYSRATRLLNFFSELCRVSTLFRDCFIREMMDTTLQFRGEVLMTALMRSMFGVPPNVSSALSELNFLLFTDSSFKELFALEFTRDYGHLVRSSLHYPSGTTSVLDYSVQLYTIPDLCMRLVQRQENSILKLLLHAVLDFVEEHIDGGRLQFENYMDNFDDGFLSCACKDISYVLSNKGIPHYVLRERPEIILLWCRALELFEGIDMHTRQTGSHVEYDDNSWLLAFRASLRGHSVTTIFEKALDECFSEPGCDFDMFLNLLIKPVLAFCSSKLDDGESKWQWVDEQQSVAIPEFDVSSSPVSFHYPLRRFALRMAVSFCSQ